MIMNTNELIEHVKMKDGGCVEACLRYGILCSTHILSWEGDNAMCDCGCDSEDNTLSPEEFLKAYPPKVFWHVTQ